MAEQFKECPTCAAKPGSPILCDDCLKRRQEFYSKSKSKPHSTIDDMLSNAGTASQRLPLLDDPVVRGAIIRSIAQWLQLRDPRWQETRMEDVIKELQSHEDWNT